MNIHLINVTNAGTASYQRPNLRFYGQWLPQMGFVPGKLVKSIPAPGAIEFTLINEYISSYSELDASTRKRGGKLMRVPYTDIPSLLAGGRYLYNAGMNIGDALIARYGYGLIQARKLPHTAITIVRIRARNLPSGKSNPRVLFTGDWLSESGFMPKTLLIAISEPGRITFQPRDGIRKCSDLRIAYQSRMEMIQVRETSGHGKPYSYITVPVSCLRKAGFTFGDELLVSCEHDVITLQRLDFEALGF